MILKCNKDYTNYFNIGCIGVRRKHLATFSQLKGTPRRSTFQFVSECSYLFTDFVRGGSYVVPPFTLANQKMWISVLYNLCLQHYLAIFSGRWM